MPKEQKKSTEHLEGRKEGKEVEAAIKKSKSTLRADGKRENKKVRLDFEGIHITQLMITQQG